MRPFLSAASRVAVIALMLSMASGVAVAGDPVMTCQKALGKAGVTLVRAVLAAEQACLEKVVRGKLPPGVTCTDDGPGTAGIGDATTQEKVQTAIARARAAVTQRCADLPISPPPPAGLGMPASCASPEPACVSPVDDLPSLLDCLECTHVSIAHALVAMQYGTSARAARAVAWSVP